MTRPARVPLDGLTVPRGFVRASDLWDEVMRLSWPKSSHFPSQFTERVAELSASDSHRRRLWLDRLRAQAMTWPSSPAGIRMPRLWRPNEHASRPARRAASTP